MRLGAEETAATLARRPVVVTEPSASLRDAIKLMLTHHAAHLLVVDPRREHPVGVLSTLDVAGVLAWGES
jgi:CBS domain-containing protein